MPSKPASNPEPNQRRPTTLLLRRARMVNVRGFVDVDVCFEAAAGGPRGMTLILGINGAGKSTFLRALGIGLCQQREASGLVGKVAGEFIRINKKGSREDEAKIELDLVDPEAPSSIYRVTTVVRRDDSGQEILTKETQPAENFPWDAIFVCGYGVNRGTGRRSESSPSNYSRPDALGTLFDDDATLLDPEATLRALKLAIDESADGGARFREMQLHLKALLELGPSYKIEITSKEVLFHGPWGTLPFHALGDGYRGTAGWFLDFFRRAHIANRAVKGEGIVLIDEIDEHLHPSWQQKLVKTLKERFPRIQFLGTTHSPMSIVNCGPGELLICSLNNTKATLHPLDGPEGKTADSILRGEWFGLKSTLDSDSAELLDAYEKAVIAKRPEEEVAALRAKLRDRLGRLIESPIDELAIEIADEVRRQGFENSSPKERRQRISEAAELLRARLRQSEASS